MTHPRTSKKLYTSENYILGGAKKKLYPESTVPDRRHGVRNAQENGGSAQDPVDRCEARAVPRFGVRVVVQVHFEALHLVEVARGDVDVAISFELLQRLWTLLTLQVGPPSCHDSWLWHPSWHLDRKIRLKCTHNTAKPSYISGTSPTTKTKFLSLNRTQSRSVIGLHTGHNILRRHLQ